MRSTCKGLTIVVVTFSLHGCASTREPVSLNALGNGDPREFEHVVLVTRDSVAHDLVAVHVRADSVFGTEVQAPAQPFHTALSNVARLDVVTREAAGPVKAVGIFLLDTLVEFGRLLATLGRCVAARC